MKMKNTILKMFRYSCLLFVIVFGLIAIIGTNGGGGNGDSTTTTWELTKEEWDYVNDGTIDEVIYYTYDANGNMTKEEYDSDNDGTIDHVYYYTWELL